MDARQVQLMLTHSISISEQFKIVTNVYDNTFSRNWYKLSGVVVDDSKKGLETVLAAPSNYPNHFAVTFNQSKIKKYGYEIKKV